MLHLLYYKGSNVQETRWDMHTEPSSLIVCGQLACQSLPLRSGLLQLFLLTVKGWIGCSTCRWCFDVELLYLCNRLHFPVHEVAVTWTEIPGSKINLLSIAPMLLELLFVHLGYGLHIWEVHTSLVQAWWQNRVPVPAASRNFST